jgi:hypothetical protein
MNGTSMNFDVNRKWVSHYVQNNTRAKGRNPDDHTFPLTAVFAVNDELLEGTIADEIVELETPYKLAVDSQADRMDEDAKRARHNCWLDIRI